MYPDIPAGADILFIGTAPGAFEERARRPFVGPSGRLVRAWLKSTGLLDRAGFANVELHRTPGNRDPIKKEVRACAPVLVRTIQGMKPKAIVCLGGISARHLGFKGSVGRMVGRFARHAIVEKGVTVGEPLITVLYHPGAFLGKGVARDRYAEMEGLVLDALRELIVRLEGGREAPVYPWRLHARTDILGATLACDTETEVAGTDPDPRLDALETVAVYDGEEVARICPDLPPDWRAKPLTFHHAQYDLVVLGRHGLDLQSVRCDDTMIEAWLLGETPLGLKPLARRLLGCNVIEYDEARAAGGDTWMSYVAQDPVLTWELHQHLRPRLETLGSAWYYDHVEAPLQPILAAGTLRGFNVDQERLEVLRDTMEQRKQALFASVRAAAGCDFNPNSPQQVAAVLYDRVGIPAPRNRSTDSDVLMPLAGAYPIIHLLLSYRKAQVMLSRYITPLLGLETVSCLYNTMGAETGRLSASKRNLQNLMVPIQRCLRARPGMVFVTGDYSQIELRLAAYLSRDEYLLEVLRTGRDMHGELCQEVYGVVTPELRTRAKSANFERLFGGGDEKRAAILQVSPARVAHVGSQWQQFDRWADAQRGKPDVWTLLGLRRILRDAQSTNKELRGKAEREAINTPIQGSSGGICKYAQVLIEPLMRELGGYVLHQVHDSVMSEAPIERAQEAAEATYQMGQAAIPDEVKAVIEIPMKVTISEYWE